MGLSRRAYAAHRGCDESSVRQAIAEERIEVLADGTIDPVDADRRWKKTTGKPRNPAGKRGGQAMVSKTDADAAKTEAYTEYLKLRTAKLAGELLDRAEVERAVAQLATEFRDRFQAFGQREAPLAAAACGGDAAELRRYLDQAMRAELETMSDGALDFERPGEDSEEDWPDSPEGVE